MANDDLNQIANGLINRKKSVVEDANQYFIEINAKPNNLNKNNDYYELEELSETWEQIYNDTPKDEPKYDNMHAINIKLRKKAILTALDNFIIKVGALFIAGTIIVAGGVALKKYKESNEDSQDNSNKIVDLNNDTAPITLDACDFSNLMIILRQSTPNVDEIVSSTEKELTDIGVDNCVITSDDNLIEEIAKIKTENTEKDIIVINIDGYANNTAIENIIMTDYDNDAKSADPLAIAISSSSLMKSEIRCGKNSSYGGRIRTSVENMLIEANYNDVTSLTVAPKKALVDSNQNVESISESIIDGIIRFASLPQEQRYLDIIRRVEYGDTISQLAETNGVNQNYIINENKNVLSNPNQLKNDVALVVKEIPENLTASVIVEKHSNYTM